MTGNGSEKKVSVKIVVDIKAKKVVFAEAGNQFVDFIFSILSLPLSTVTKLLRDNNMVVGSLGALYTSIESFKQNDNIDSLLKPTLTVSVPLLSVHDSLTAMKLYWCQSDNYIASSRSICPSCKTYPLQMSSYSYLSNAMSSSSASSPRYVNGEVSYLVTDNLDVKPMSFTLIKSLVKDFDSLEEKEVEVGFQEGLAILKASLESNAVLTAVFLEKFLPATDVTEPYVVDDFPSAMLRMSFFDEEGLK